VCTLSAVAGDERFSAYELPVLIVLSELHQGNFEHHQCPKLKTRCRSCF